MVKKKSCFLVLLQFNPKHEVQKNIRLVESCEEQVKTLRIIFQI